MADQALQSQARMADIFKVDPQTLGIWLGVDNMSATPGHYPQGASPHGVHTLMTGLALRLEWLASWLTTPGIILMEGGRDASGGSAASSA